MLAILSSLQQETELPGPVAEDLETVRRNVELEARLIDDLLDLTRITSGKLELHCKQVTIGRLIEDAINTCQADIKTKRLRLRRVHEQATQLLSADPARITQILWNLIKNAVKFTPEGGCITIRSRAVQENGIGTVIVEVHDTGMGIEPERLGRIFEAFEQGDRRITKQFGGLGLGLAISRAIAESHQGDLSVTSEGLGHGATFTLRLPLDGCLDEPEEGAPVAAAPVTPLSSIVTRPLRILLVEDHADTAAILVRLLSRMGHEVMHAATISGALRMAHQEMRTAGIDLVMSDLGLPDGSGLDLMRELSTAYGLRGIALSGFGMESDLEQSHAAGYARHLIKPIDIALMKETIAQLTQQGTGG